MKVIERQLKTKYHVNGSHCSVLLNDSPLHTKGYSLCKIKCKIILPDGVKDGLLYQHIETRKLVYVVSKTEGLIITHEMYDVVQEHNFE